MFDFSAALAARAAHAQTCTRRPCKECGLESCPRCRRDMIIGGESRELDGSFELLRMCEACADAFVSARRINHVEAPIPPKFTSARVGAPELRQRVQLEPSAFKAAYREAMAGKSLVLHGGQGCGKTSVAVALFRAILDRGRGKDATKENAHLARRAFFVSSYDLARDRARHKLGDGESPLIERAMRASLCVIDDLGSEAETQLSGVGDVVYERWGQDRPTWVTTWANPEEIGVKYGGGIARRVFENAHVVEVG